MAIVVALLIWPADADGEFGPEIVVGRVADFPVGEVVTFRYSTEGELLQRPDVRTSPNTRTIFHVVQVTPGEFLALYAKDPHLGCMVPWLPEYEVAGETGWFLNPCHGERYNIRGERVFGPAPRGLDRFSVTLRGELVVVDLSDLQEGPRTPPPEGLKGEATPAPTATATAGR